MALTPLPIETTHALKSRAATALDIAPGLGAFVKGDYLRSRRWGAVIAEGDFHDADGLVSRGIAASATRPVVCAGLADYMTDGYGVPVTHRDFAAVRKTYVEPSYVITDDFETFLLVSDSDYYWGIAADRALLTDVFGQTVPSRLDAFAEGLPAYLGSGDSHDQIIGRMLGEYLARCRVACAQIGLLDADLPLETVT